MAIQDFPELFRRATGREPYRYQVQLAEQPLPDVLEVPTGSGKTHAILTSWLYQQAAGHAPRRLVYALPMRSLVEQTAKVAVEVRNRLGRSPAELPIHVLMGGVGPSDWRERPEVPQILIGTIDMLLSRALGRGYAEGRFAWPVSFGLLNSDCRWVLDEVQLMGPARSTSAQLDALRAKLGTLHPCQTLWASATVDRNALRTVDRPDLGEILSLPGQDRSGPLAQRLDAQKTLERVDLAAEAMARVPRMIAEVVKDRHRTGERTLVVLNTVSRAQAVARELMRSADRGGPAVVLVHSRFRPTDRQNLLDAALRDVGPGGPGLIVVATQVIEAGVDVSCRLLATESAPFSSVVQRLGRCNRAGEHADASVVWLDAGPLEEGARGVAAAAPYPPADLNATRAELLKLIGDSLSPAALERRSVFETRDDPITLRRSDLFDLFDTSPDLSGLDVDVAPFIRADDDRSVSVFFRELPGKRPNVIAAQAEPSADRDEIVSIPLSQLVKRDAWLFDHEGDVWLRRGGRDVPPGATALLDAAAGGYDAVFGWDPTLTDPVAPAAQSAPAHSPEAVGDDPRSFGGEAQELSTHLELTAQAATQIASNMRLTGMFRDALVQAAALHDLGKAHPVFQETILKALSTGADPTRLWAKSGGHGGFRHRRRYFRHELASALALRELAGALGVSNTTLVTYLIASHHGRVRLSIRPGADERRPPDAPSEARFALGIAEGDSLPAVQTPFGQTAAVVLELGCMELGGSESWTQGALALRDADEIGPFRLATLEALVRVADWRAGG